MARDIALRRVESVLGELSYPVLRPDAAVELSDVTVDLPDGERNLGILVSETRDDSYHSVEELVAELQETTSVDSLTGSPGEDEDRAV